MMATELKELRGDAPAHLVGALDAIALAYGMTRTALVNKLLARDVNEIAHRANVLQRMAAGNPLLSDPSAPTSDWSAL